MECVEGETTDHADLYRNLVELVQIAETGGMHAFWTGEHHGMAFTITPNPFQVLVDLSNKTQSIRLGTGTIVAPFWHPIKLAGEAALADILTGGRLELGIARGAYSFEYDRLSPGLDAWGAGQRMREITPLLPRLWRGDCENTGAFYPFPKTTACPRPVQKSGPPIWVAARDPSSHEFALRNHFNVQVTPLWQGSEEITTLMQRYKAAVHENRSKESDPKTKIMLLQHAYIGKDQADCAMGAEALSRFYNYFGAWFKNERPIAQGKIQSLSADDIQNNAMMSVQNMQRNLLIGEKNEVIERLQHYQALGYDEFSLWLDNGLPHAVKKEQLTVFIEKIMPALKEE